MKSHVRHIGNAWLLAAALTWPALAGAQVPVDESGNPIGEIEAGTNAGAESLAVLSAAELEDLIGPIALYPDDLLAIVLPASTYPLQIVEAARFLERLENDSSLKPDEDWDDSVVALTNYPEVVEMMNEDLDWTWQLGEAVVAQQTDVIKAIEAFRDRAYAAGNLKSDDFQNVTEEEGTIHITPVEEDVIYVPYYEPERVVVYQPRPVYFYYPRSYPLYYYPYPAGYLSPYDYFWGVTTAFAIGWHTHHLHVWHHSYYGHPYFGRNYYWHNWWYRRPDIHVHNNYYVRDRYNVTYDRYHRGDYWQPRSRRTVRADQRLTRTRFYPNSATRDTAVARTSTRSGFTPASRSGRGKRPEITFRERNRTPAANRETSSRSTFARPSTERRSTLRSDRQPSFARPSASRPVTPTQEPTLRSPSSTPRASIRRSTQSPRPTARPSASARRSTTARLPESSRRPALRQPSPSRQSTLRRPGSSRQESMSPSRSSRPAVARPSAPQQSSQARPSRSSSSQASRSNSSGNKGSRRLSDRRTGRKR